MSNKEENYVMDESVEYMLTNYMSFGKGVEKEYVNNVIFNISYDIKKDFRQSVKLFVTDGLVKDIMRLNYPGIVLLFHIMNRLKRNDNRVYLSASIFVEETQLSEPTFYRGLRQLKEEKWIFETKPKHYNVNVTRIFKGSIDKLLVKYQVQTKANLLNLEDRANKIIENKNRVQRELESRRNGD